MDNKMRDEINKYAEKEHFYTVLELLNNILYRENFISFNENLTRICERDTTNSMMKELDLINKIACDNDKISNNLRFIKYKESVNEIKSNK
jgi:hypothetical protein